MAKYNWNAAGNELSINLAEDGQPPMIHTVDISTMKPEIHAAAMRFGFATIFRNATAGKMDELDKALAAIKSRHELFNAGKWASDNNAKSSVELSDDEKNDIVVSVVVNTYKAKGDQRTPDQILEAFNGAPEATQEAILAALKGAIDKGVKEALRKKKSAAKAKVDLPQLG